MTNKQLAEQFAKEFHENKGVSPLDRNEWRAICMFAEWLDKRAVEPSGDVVTLHTTIQTVMARLADLLDADQFNNIEAIVLDAGVPYPPLNRQAEPTAECPHCREVYEIWANTEGFTPVYATESYQQRVIERMREAAAKGLAQHRQAEPAFKTGDVRLKNTHPEMTPRVFLGNGPDCLGCGKTLPEHLTNYNFCPGLPENRMAEARIAPWHDFKGGLIREGDEIAHPDGQHGKVIFLAEHTDPGDQWRVDYRDGCISRLCLQIGDKGQAVVTPNRSGDPK